MTRKAYSFVRTFAAGPARDFCVDRHYLLCASAGALRLEAQGQAWLLPLAQAALIEAGQAIQVSIPRPVTTASVLFDTGFAPPPPAPLTVLWHISWRLDRAHGGAQNEAIGWGLCAGTVRATASLCCAPPGGCWRWLTAWHNGLARPGQAPPDPARPPNRSVAGIVYLRPVTLRGNDIALILILAAAGVVLGALSGLADTIWFDQQRRLIFRAGVTSGIIWVAGMRFRFGFGYYAYHGDARTGARQELKVRQSSASTANVRLDGDGKATTFPVHCGGLLIPRMVNELGIAETTATEIAEARAARQVPGEEFLDRHAAS